MSISNSETVTYKLDLPLPEALAPEVLCGCLRPNMSDYPSNCPRTRKQKSILEDLRRFDQVSAVTLSKVKRHGTASHVTDFDRVDRKKTVAQLALRIAQLPDVPKKVLAMYYYENMRLSEIAACFGLSGSRISQIRTKTVALLRNDLFSSLD